MSETARCYRDRDNGVYFTREAHHVACTEADCRGCRPCAEDHCQAAKNCTWHTAEGEITCGRCLGGGRKHLRWVGDLAALTLTQAIADGVDSQAAMLAGPATDPRSWSERRLAQRRHLSAWEGLGRITEDQHLHALESLEEDDWQHAYSVLTRWQMMIAEDYGHELPARLSIAGAIAYLDRNLHRIAQDPEQDFPQLRRELRKCRQHLEAVLHNDDRPDRGAPCPDCTSETTGVGPRLVRVWAQGATVDRYDEWQCPRNPNDHKWTHVAYLSYVEKRRKATA